MSGRRLAAASFVWVLVLLGSTPGARAQCGDGPAITVSFVGEAWSEQFAGRVLRELAAGARVQGFEVCREGDAPVRPVAQIRLATTELPRVSVSIEVRDHVTEKRLAREVDLAAFTEDSRALGLAVATDELLRASWLELALESARPRLREAPREVTRVVRRDVEAARERRTELGVAGTAVAYTEGVRLFGADAYVSHRLTERVGITIAFGAGFGPSEPSQNGRIRVRALGAGPSLFVRLLHGALLSLDVHAGGRAISVEYDGDAGPAAVARTDSGLALAAQLGLVGSLVLGRLVLRAGADIGGVLRAVGAADDGERALAVGGMLLSGSLGIGVAL